MRRASGTGSPNLPLGYGVTNRGIGSVEGGSLMDAEGGFTAGPSKKVNRRAVGGMLGALVVHTILVRRQSS